MCAHEPSCPSPYAVDYAAAHIVAAHPEQGWNLLCNGVITFDDGVDLVPDAAGAPEVAHAA